MSEPDTEFDRDIALTETEEHGYAAHLRPGWVVGVPSTAATS